MERSCAACGEPLKSNHPRKRFCNDACRKRGHRGATVTQIADASSARVSVADATRSALEEADRLATPAGAAAMVLASRLDLPGRDTGSAVAAMTRELRSVLAEALANAAAEADPIDEVGRKREERLRAIGS